MPTIMAMTMRRRTTMGMTTATPKPTITRMTTATTMRMTAPIPMPGSTRKMPSSG